MQEAPELAILVNRFSKTYAMTGWRLGYAAGPRELIGAIGDFQSQTTSNPNSIAQKAGVKALHGPQAAVAIMVQEFEERGGADHRLVHLRGTPTPDSGSRGGAGRGVWG